MGRGVILSFAFCCLASAEPAIDFGTVRYLTVEFEDGVHGAIDPGTILLSVDLTADGRADLVALQDSSLMVFVSVARGSYRQSTLLPVPSWVETAVAADFDGDKAMDLAVGGSHLDSELLVFAGGGDGTFEPERRFPTGTPFLREPGLVVVDTEGDPWPDLIVFGSTARLLRNRRGHGFEAPRPIDEHEGQVNRYVVGDFNGDGLDDVTWPVSEDRGDMLLADGSGGYGPAIPYELHEPAGWYVDHVRAMDFDQDGVLDLLRRSSRGLVVLYGDGTGGFERDRSFPIANPHPALPGDYDHDGITDLLIGKTVHFGDGRGRYAPRWPEIPELPTSPLRVLDLDQDGYLDLVSQRYATFLPGTPFGRFVGGPRRASSPSPNLPEPGAAGDWNGDGVADLAGYTFDATSWYAWCSYGDGEGGFSDPVRLGDLLAPSAVSTSDLDADGNLDLVFAGWGLFPWLHWITVLYGDGVGSFAAPVEVLRGAKDTNGVRSSDLDGDGLPELIVHRRDGIAVYRRESADRYVMLDDLNPGVPEPALPTVVDFDGDGRGDVVHARRRSLAVHRTDANGRVSADPSSIVALEFAANVATLVALDFDGDGWGDLAIVTLDGRHVWFRCGRSGRMRSVPLGRTSFPVLSGADLNSRVGEELVISSQATHIVTWNDELSTARPYAFRHATSNAIVGEFNGDAHSDLLSWSLDQGVRVIVNRSFDAIDCRRGNVDATDQGPVDVLWVNDSPGRGPRRGLLLDSGERLVVRIDAPPSSEGTAPYALFLWAEHPDAFTVELLPHDIGLMCMPIPWTAGSHRRLVVWNNLGHSTRLGEPSRQSDPAPSVVIDCAPGPQMIGDFFLQGVIADERSPSGRVAWTNGIALRIE